MKKKMLCMVLAVVMVFSLVGCGEISYDDIKGDWTTTKISGMTPEEYASALGVTVAQVAVNITISDDDKITFTNATSSEKMDYERRSNGIEVKQEGKDEIFVSMAYDEEKKTLTYKVKVENGELEYVLEKGTTDLTIQQAPAEETPTEQVPTEEATGAVQ